MIHSNTNHDPLQLILGRLGRVKQTSEGQWEALCPAHNDNRPSLSVSRGADGQALVHCHRGCAVDSVLAEIGLSKADLFPRDPLGPPRRPNTQANTQKRGEIVATYDYHDPAGETLFQVVRYEPKRFYQRRPDGNGDWIWNIKGVRRVLYRLPEVLAADSSSWIFVVEGERDSESLAAIGIVATTCPQGAGKWSKVDDSPLEGRRVAILPDNDKPGRKHAEQVARSLVGRAEQVRVAPLPDLPAKGDVTDWLEAGGTAEKLLVIVEQSPAFDEGPEGAPDDADGGGEETAGIPYRETDHGLVWDKHVEDDFIEVQLTNFSAGIVSDIIRDDGAEASHQFEIKATVGGEETTTRFTIPASRFAGMSWIPECLGASAFIFPGFALKDHTRVAIQMLSAQTLEKRMIYAHTGWRKLDGGNTWVFLHADGAIGPNGPVPGIEVGLDADLARFSLPDPPTGPELVQAIQSTLRMLTLAPDEIMLPVVCAVWRTPLGRSSFAMHLAGQTGTFKTELAALAQQHFGSGLDARHLPGSWSSTGNALEGLAFTLKDMVLVVDDFAPSGTTSDTQRLHRDAARLIRAQGNRSGRRRMRSDSTLRPVKPPRGLIISTGEDVPHGQSIRARMLVVEIEPETINVAALTCCQQDARFGKSRCEPPPSRWPISSFAACSSFYLHSSLTVPNCSGSRSQRFSHSGFSP